MKAFLKNTISKLTSAGEMAALKHVWTELQISRHHRAGLRKIRKHNLQRPKTLNLGCGLVSKAGFLNVDLFPGGDITLDLRRGLPFEPESCDVIFSEHFFEHIEYPDTALHLFSECLRVLRPGGELKFSVPDTEWPLIDYARGPAADYYVACDRSNWHPPYCTTRMEHINYHFRQKGEHVYAYDFETAAKVLAQAGFVAISKREYDPAVDSRDRRLGSLFVSARRP